MSWKNFSPLWSTQISKLKIYEPWEINEIVFKDLFDKQTDVEDLGKIYIPEFYGKDEKI